MAFLDGLIKAGLSGYTGYLTGRDIKAQRDKAEADKAYERERQAREDALRDALLRSQAEAADALALQRRTPDVRNIDPLSEEGIAAAEKRAAAIERARARYRAQNPTSTERQLTPGQQNGLTDDEAQGLGVLDTMHHATGPVHDAYFSAWRTARKQLPGITPGRLSLQVFQALRQTRPDLFTDGAGGGLTYGAPATTMPAYAGAPGGGARVTPGYSPEARQRFNGGQAPTAPAAPAAIPPAELTEARALIRGSPTPEEDLRSVGYTDAEIRVILGS
jgi:hypothetical protein